ncbi:MAG: hypothetical protein OXL98_03180 [Acidimicrobiaceae bacterium]|nr:hypothetical protein [Acidimicrobiaceae bacterium]
MGLLPAGRRGVLGAVTVRVLNWHALQPRDRLGEMASKLLKELGKGADDAEQEALTAMRSAPFDPPERGRIAVKIVTATGMEMTTVHSTTQ